MKFNAEIKETKQSKLASLDQQYRIVLITDNSDILDLGKYPSDTMFEITIEPK